MCQDARWNLPERIAPRSRSLAVKEHECKISKAEYPFSRSGIWEGFLFLNVTFPLEILAPAFSRSARTQFLDLKQSARLPGCEDNKGDDDVSGGILGGSLGS